MSAYHTQQETACCACCGQPFERPAASVYSVRGRSARIARCFPCRQYCNAQRCRLVERRLASQPGLPEEQG